MGIRQRASRLVWGVRARGRIRGSRYYVSPGARISVARGARLVLGSGVHISSGCVLVVRETSEIGADVYLGRNVTVVAYSPITIGSGSLLAENVSIHTENHRGRALSEYTSAPIVIGRRCWIGAGAVLTQGTEVGDLAVIGANSVVTRSVPPQTVAAGVPAEVLHRRTDI